MKIKQVFKTEDGGIFDSLDDAEKYVASLFSKDELDYVNFLDSYCGTRLLKLYSLDEFGFWEILGEDPNCDFGGYHHMPKLGVVQSTLDDAIKHAIKLQGFYTWGSGGDIRKVDITKL